MSFKRALTGFCLHICAGAIGGLIMQLCIENPKVNPSAGVFLGMLLGINCLKKGLSSGAEYVPKFSELLLCISSAVVMVPTLLVILDTLRRLIKHLPLLDSETLVVVSSGLAFGLFVGVIVALIYPLRRRQTI